MAELIFTERALRDLERLTEFLRESEPAAAVVTTGLIMEALSVLRNHPLIGRPAEFGLRELVISRGESGYLALYRYGRSLDRAIVLAIRHQRESGYLAVDEPEV